MKISPLELFENLLILPSFFNPLRHLIKSLLALVSRKVIKRLTFPATLCFLSSSLSPSLTFCRLTALLPVFRQLDSFWKAESPVLSHSFMIAVPLDLSGWMAMVSDFGISMLKELLILHFYLLHA